ncbi:coatomer subunit zeta-1 [Eurytemora carolleeae]|uniref:coatomer subunit zeta-1 n=1 Tax=Eurytemora carolleeae TaxID=1294199 RepID=UPI000C78044F|nr:coatomer subunit zeta-1 [Eurytemora carolleeae]|eukprot:XP_023336573.1 coatomer subunit zeta-1-like [Eurytemora affinis]
MLFLAIFSEKMGLEAMHLEPALETIKAVLILDNNGTRILAKYYDSSVLSTPQEQKKFEKNLFGKTHKANSEIIMYEGMTCLYKSNVDLFFYIIGSVHENELVLMSVLDCIYNSVSQILRKNVDRRSLLDNLEVVMLALDEMIDNGIILEADPAALVARVALRADDIPLGEQTVAQVLQSAKEQLKWSLLK